MNGGHEESSEARPRKTLRHRSTLPQKKEGLFRLTKPTQLLLKPWVSSEERNTSETNRQKLPKCGVFSSKPRKTILNNEHCSKI